MSSPTLGCSVMSANNALVMGAVTKFLKRELTGWRFVFNFFFHGGHWASFAAGWYFQETNPRLKALNTLHESVWISRGAGLNLSFDALMICVPMCRTLLRWVRPKMRWLPLDENQWFHRQVAYQMLFWTVVHVCCHYVNFINIEITQLRPVKALQIHYTEANGITGHTMILCMVFIFTTAHAKIRHQSFEAFWYTHHLFIPFFLALYTHATGCFVRATALPYSPFAGYDFWHNCIGYQAWRWELFGGTAYLIERLYREVRARRATEIVKVIRHPYDALELQFRKPSMKYKAGQWLFVNIPSVSKQQWHPFTITSCPYDPYISVHMRQLGDWTRAVGDALGAGPAQAKEYDALDPMGMYEVALRQGQQMPRIRIDGPYGAPAEDVFDNEIAVLIGTGIGVTPWAAILKNIWHLRAGPNPPKRLRRVEFIWVCRDTTSFEWFQTLLSSLEAQSKAAAADEKGGFEFLRIHTYLTQKLDQDTQANIILNSVGAAVDPLTELQTRTNFGRPDFKRLFGAIKTGIQDGTYINGIDNSSSNNVGVYFCGPNAAAKDIKKATKDVSGDGVKFSFWKEHF
ncbi:MAG: hypothetical protein MMC33_000243 [Icmadophila ericetorum]|nr:hypothetical protein [Icmadophila ericetorum]